MEASLTCDEFFEGYPESRRIYAAVERAIERVGPADVRITKSQIAFRRRAGFAWVWIPGRYLSGDRPPLVLSVALPRRDRSPRWKEVVEPRAGRFMHHLEIASEGTIDREVVGWIQEAWRAAGETDDA